MMKLEEAIETLIADEEGFIVRKVTMDEDKFKNLPEFTGF